MATADEPACGALAGLRVADLTGGVAGPVAGMLLADLGADVVNLGPPDAGPSAQSPGRYMWGRGKRSFTVRPGCASDLAAADTLIRAANVVLVGAGPHAPGQPGLDYDSLRGRGLTPGEPACWVVMPPFLLGHTPWTGGGESAGLLFAWLGHAWSQASYEDRPVDSLYPVALYMQGIWAATTAVAALAGRQAGRAIAPLVVAGGAHGGQLISPGSFAANRDEPHQHRPGGPGGTLPNYRCYRCADGSWLFLGAFTAAFIERGFRAIGAGALLDDPRVYGDPDAVRQPGNLEWITTELERIFLACPREHWLAVLEEADVPAAPVGIRDDWLDHPQIRAAGLRAESVTAAGEPIIMPGPLIGLSVTPVEPGPPATNRRPVLAGLDPAADLGWTVRPRTRWAPAVGKPEPPLTGRRILDLGTIIAGPYASTLLAELGADVIKVERPPLGDDFRVAHGGRGGEGFPVYNREQRSVFADLTTLAGRSAFFSLAATADVVIDNYRPGVAERLGIAHADLAAVAPQMTSVSINAYGNSGPLSRRPGFDPVIQAMSGIMRAQGGENEADSPAFLTVPVNDVTAAALAALGAAAALYATPRIGAGQHVTATLCAASCLLQSAELVRLEGAARLPVGGRDFRGPSATDRLYECANGWVRLGLQGGDVDKLTDAGLVAPTGASPEPGVLTEAIAAAVAALTVSDVLRRASATGIPAVRARKPQELTADTDLLRRGLLAVSSTDNAGVRSVRAGRWLDMPGMGRPTPGDAPKPGEHAAVISALLGADMSVADSEELRRASRQEAEA